MHFQTRLEIYCIDLGPTPVSDETLMGDIQGSLLIQIKMCDQQHRSSTYDLKVS
jgi:hypothetical protein